MTALDQRTREEIRSSTSDRDLNRSLTPLGSMGRRTPTIAMASLLILHGLAHFVGVVTAFDAFGANAELEYLGGTWMVGNDLLIGLLGMLWATLGLAFVFSAVAVVTEYRGWESTLIMLATLSVALCVLALWASWVGIIVNAVIMAVAVASSSERLPGPPRIAV